MKGFRNGGVCVYIVSLLLPFWNLAHGQEDGAFNRLAGDQYIATTNVESHAAFAKDVEEMRRALLAQDFDTVKDIYENGANVFGLDESGNPDTSFRKSLKSLSTEETKFMETEILFNLYANGFQSLVDKEGKFDGRVKEEYGDAIVNDLFSLGTDQYGRAIDASILVNLWMAIVHTLNLAVETCEQASTTLDPSFSTLTAQLIDMAAAYWIGSGVDPESNLNGQLMYQVAEDMALRFNQDNGQSPVNKKMIDHLNAAKQTSVLCLQPGDDVALHMRLLKNKMISIMTIPLVQSFIHSIETQDSLRAELHGVSVLPQISACSPSEYQYFLDTVVLEIYDPADKEEVLQRLQSMYSCLGITCAEVGEYINSSLDQKCTDDKQLYAGYASVSDDPLLQEASQIDLDILQLQILVSLGADEAAKDLYNKGRNSLKTTDPSILKVKGFLYNSLDAYASDPSNAIVKLQEEYQAYYQHPDYATFEIMQLFDDDNAFRNIPNEGRSWITAKLSQYLGMYIPALQYLQLANELCAERDVNEAVKNWDYGAVTLIGSTEGTGARGNPLDDGYLIFGVLEDTCEMFNTCHYIERNDVRSLTSILSSGAVGLVGDTSCETSRKAYSKITSILQATLFQSALHYAHLMDTETNRTWKNIGTWYASILAVAPLVAAVDPFVAKDMFELTRALHAADFNPASYNYQGQKVRRDIQKVASIIHGMDCTDIGITEGLEDICKNDSVQIEPPSAPIEQPEVIEEPVSDPPTPSPTASKVITIQPTEEPEIIVDLSDPPTPSPTASKVTTSRPTITKVVQEPVTEVADSDTLNFDGLFKLSQSSEISVARFALDVRDMKNSETVDAARDIFVNGKNAPLLNNPGAFLPLQALSTAETTFMTDELIFNLYKYAFKAFSQVTEDQWELDKYANEIVEAYFQLGVPEVSAEAVVILITWVYITHHLEDVVSKCKLAGENPTRTVDLNTPIDQAAAMWVGVRDDGMSPNGYLMYSLAESARSKFNFSSVNRDILNLFTKVKNDYILNDRCQTDPDGWLRLRLEKNRIISKMTIPLVQNLIIHMANDDVRYAQLYSFALNPLISGCSQNTFDFITDNVIKNQYDPVKGDSLVTAVQSMYSCLGISCREVGEYNVRGALPECEDPIELQPLAGFNPQDDVRHESKIDLDILQIQILMEMGATDTAKDIFVNGQNSEKCEGNCGYNSLIGYAESDNSNVKDQFQAFRLYFGMENYSAEMMKDSFGRSLDGPAGVPKVAQHVIMYMYPLHLMYSALEFCNGSNTVMAKKDWSRAGANLIGLIEGTSSGVSANDDGKLMYSVLKETCARFGTCYYVDSQDTRSLVSLMNRGTDFASIGQCSTLETILDEAVSILQAALVQNTIYYALELDGPDQGDDRTFNIAAGQIAALAVVPLVQVGNPGAANTLKDMVKDPESVDADDVVNAFKRAVPLMTGLDCRGVGTLEGFGGFCIGDIADETDVPDESNVVDETDVPDESNVAEETDVPDESNVAEETDTLVDEILTLAPTPGSSAIVTPWPTVNIEDLVDGPTFLDSYINTTDVTQIMSIALDIRDMRNSPDSTTAQRIFEFPTNTKFAFKNLIMDDIVDMQDEITFNLYKYGFTALADPDGTFDGEPIDHYADAVVHDLLQVNDVNSAASAAVILGSWMSIVHQLEVAVNQCKLAAEEISVKSEDIIPALDKAAALWVGERNDDKGTAGYMMYSFAESAKSQFPSSTVNRDVLKMMNSVKNFFVHNDRCSVDPDAWLNLRLEKNRIISKMTIPLVQNLFHYAVEGDLFRITLFALALNPLISGCSQNTFMYLKENLLEKPYNLIIKNQLIANVQSMYSCLGISCREVGEYNVRGAVPECEDPIDVQPLADFDLQVDLLQESKIDLDILQMQILMEMGATDTAKDIFTNGQNSEKCEGNCGYNSLRAFSLIDSSNVKDQFQAFRLYFGTPFYGIEMMDESVGPITTSKVAQYVIMYMYPLHLMYSALEFCNGDSTIMAKKEWSRAGASLIGLIEGTSANDDGKLMYSVLKETCARFGTCYYLNSFDERSLASIMNRGTELASIGQCSTLETILDDVVSILQAALVQSAIDYALKLDGPDQGDDRTFNIAAGQIAALAVVPLVQVGSPEPADILKDMVRDPESVDADDVVNAFKLAVPLMTGLDCRGVGTLEGFGGFCIVEETEVPTNAPTEEKNISGPQIDVHSEFPFNRYPVDEEMWKASKLDLDVKQMRLSESLDDAIDIYSEGVNAEISFQSLSLNATDDMWNEPIYNLFVFALATEPLFADDDTSFYGDLIASDAFEMSRDLGIESAVVINLWMFIVHTLYSVLDSCELGRNAEEFLDVAFSLWVGSEQAEGNNDGFLLYSIAERAEAQFTGDAIDPGQSEAKANTKLINLFNEARQLVHADDYCSSEKFGNLQVIVSSMHSTMTIPLIQQLIYHLHQEEHTFIELYAFSIMPLMAGCNPASYNLLKHLLVDQRFKIDDLDAVMRALENSYNCLGITCDDVGIFMNTENTCNDKITSMAGFVPSADSREQAKIDLDILQIGMLVSMESYDAARNLYSNGRNSLRRDGNGLSSLDDISIMVEEEQTHDSVIMSVLNRVPPFKGMDSMMLAGLVVDGLKMMVSLHAAPALLEDAVSLCKANSAFLGRSKVDEGAALLIGSLESSRRGGSSPPQGVLLYALAKSMCIKFGTCAPSGDAIFNEKLITLLQDTSNSIGVDTTCDSTREHVDGIKKMLLIPVIQGLLHTSLSLEDAKSSQEFLTRTGLFADGYILAQAILPFINNPTNKETLRKNLIAPLSDDFPLLPDGPTEIFKILQDEIADMGIDCKDIGEHTLGGLCVTPPATDDATDLGSADTTTLSNGLYTTTTNVGDRHKISKDIQEMINALDSGDKDLAELIYKKGLSAWKYDENGKRTSEKWALQEFSINSGTEMIGDPVYNIYRYALQDLAGNFLDQRVDLYADTFVRNSFDNGRLAADAAVALNLWMAIVHKLYAAVSNCKANIHDGNVHVLDEAAAFYIGDDQLTGFASTGNLLYALAEDMGARFNQDSSGQSEVNRRVLGLLNSAKDQVTFVNACRPNTSTHVKLKHIADELVSVMAIPLLQSLIHNMYLNNQAKVKLYATSIVPLLAGCNPKTYEKLRELLIDNDYKEVLFNAVMELLQSTYPCLDLTCEDIGFYVAANIYTCENPPELNPIAGYIPITDVHEYAELDQDLLQMKILLEMKAYDAAQDLYLNGKSCEDKSGNYRSLYFLATNNYRENVPEYMTFQRYFEDYDYADTTVSAALAGVAPFDKSTTAQKTAIIMNTLQYTVMYMRILSLMYDSVDQCRQGTAGGANPNPWDEAVASYIGSMEGTDDHGNKENPGLFLFGLAQQRCDEFGTCDNSGNANINNALFTLFDAGQSELISGNCDALASAVEKIRSLIQVPLIQSTLSLSIINAQKEFGTRDPSLATGFVFANSLLPLVNEVDGGAANVIQKNMAFQSLREPVFQGASAIFAAFEDAIPKMGKIDCNDVGIANGMDVCAEEFTVTTDRSRNQIWNKTNIAVVAVVGGLFLLILAVLIALTCRKRGTNNLERGTNGTPAVRQDEGDEETGGTGKVAKKGPREVVDTMGVVD